MGNSQLKLCERISETRKGFRDVHWCGILNEPVIVQYKENRLYCPLCEMISEQTDEAFLQMHLFQFHINKI